MIRIVAALILGAAVGLAPRAASAIPITSPPDLNPGDPYRLVFVSSTRTDARSIDIADYNAFASGVANGVPQLAALGTVWLAIASTHTVHARDNTGTNPAASGLPIYNLDGIRVANDYADLWDSSLQASIKIDETGTVVPAGTMVWTGTEADGTIFATLELGAAGQQAAQGIAVATNHAWIRGGQAPTRTGASLYVISKALLAVPEPGTMALACIGAGALGAWRISRLRRRNLPVSAPSV